LCNRGMVAKTPRHSVNQPLYYSRGETAWWEVFRAALLAMGESAPSLDEGRPVLEVRRR
jgi:hypothetical protein